MAIEAVMPNPPKGLKRQTRSGHPSSSSGSSSSGVSSRAHSVNPSDDKNATPHAKDDRGIEREMSETSSIHSLGENSNQNGGGSDHENRQQSSSSHQSFKGSSSTETTHSVSPPSNNDPSERNDERRGNANKDRVQLQVWTYETRDEEITIVEKLVKQTWEQEDSEED